MRLLQQAEKHPHPGEHNSFPSVCEDVMLQGERAKELMSE